MSPAWWAAFPAVETTIACGTAEHRLRWEQGSLITADHPDHDAELAFSALGGDKAECVATMEAWQSHSDNLDVLYLGPRSGNDEITVDVDDADSWLSSFKPWSSGGTASPASGARVPASPASHSMGKQERRQKRRDELLSLLALGPAWQMRLSAAVAWAWSPAGHRSADRAAARPALIAALNGRVAPAAGQWLGIDPDDVSAELHEASGWGAVELSPAGAGRLHMGLPVGWLARVWGPGLPVVTGHLVVDVLEVSWPRAQVLALPRWSSEPVALSIGHDGRCWSVTRQ